MARKRLSPTPPPTPQPGPPSKPADDHGRWQTGLAVLALFVSLGALGTAFTENVIGMVDNRIALADREFEIDRYTREQVEKTLAERTKTLATVAWWRENGQIIVRNYGPLPAHYVLLVADGRSIPLAVTLGPCRRLSLPDSYRQPIGVRLISQAETWYLPLIGPTVNAPIDTEGSVPLTAVFAASPERPTVSILPDVGCG